MPVMAAMSAEATRDRVYIPDFDHLEALSVLYANVGAAPRCFSPPIYRSVVQNHLPLRLPFVITDAANAAMEKIKRELKNPAFQQPHPLLFSWAFNAKVDTDRHFITAAILRGQNVQPRRRLTGETLENYIFYLNDMVELLMEERNRLWDSWPRAWKLDTHLANDLLHCYAFVLDPLRERMRLLVASEGSDLRHTPSTVKATMSPKLFFTLFQEHRRRSTLAAGGGSVTVPFESAACLDFLLRPTSDGIALQRTPRLHPFFGHPLSSLWYNQTFDASNATDPHPDTPEVAAPRALHWVVDGCVTVVFSLTANTIFINCTWTGTHKRASGLGGGRDSDWVIGV